MNGGSQHRRWNPLLEEWVLVSPGRTSRPWSGEVSPGIDQLKATHVPDCPLCPGNSRASGAVNPSYEGIWIFDNDFPALTIPDRQFEIRADMLFRSEPVGGTCQVVCFGPDHSRTLAEFSLGELDQVIQNVGEACQHLDQTHTWVQFFENKGEMMGCSNPHPHGQIWAMDTLPNIAVREFESQSRYIDRHGRKLLLDVAEAESRSGERTVAENEDWIVVVPFWAVWPFETLVLPKFSALKLYSLTAIQRQRLAAALLKLLQTYDALFDCVFPYSMGWHMSPNGMDAEGWQLHAHFYPPLLRSASVRKHMVGFELLAEPQRDLLPEAAADRLRSLAKQF